MESSLFFQYVDEIEDFIEKKDWQGLEEKFYFLCSDLSGKEVADKIKEMLSDKEKLKILSEKGRNFTIQHFSWQKMVDEYKQVFDGFIH